MRVRKVGVLKETEIDIGGSEAVTLVSILTSYQEHSPSSYFQLTILIGQGMASRKITLDIPILNSILKAQQLNPINLDPERQFKSEKNSYAAIFCYKNQLFLATNEFINEESEEEACLLIKRHVLAEDKKLMRLKMEVEALERAAGQVGYKRTTIPEVVKLVVWERDEGKCVRCGSTHNLHFDHIIPVAKGGSSSEENIQLLCADCNLEKSDRIAF
jgi:HNH endonuclease